MRYAACSATDIGIGRTLNQDAVSIKIPRDGRKGCYLAGVCDGVGGLTHGEYASLCMRERLERWFLYEYPQIAGDPEADRILPERLRKTIGLQNRLLYEYGQKRGIRCVTTVSALLLDQGRYYAVHVGDSRIYRLNGKLEQITEDQTLIARKIRQRLLTQEEALREPGKHVITQGVGADRSIETLHYQGTAEGNAAFLVCSDGFYHYLRQEELLEAFWEKSFRDSGELGEELKRLIELLKSRGERDNISAAVIWRREDKGEEKDHEYK